MRYVMPVNALIMSQAGMPMRTLLTGTAFDYDFFTVLNAPGSNTPVVMSVGMGLMAAPHSLLS